MEKWIVVTNQTNNFADADNAALPVHILEFDTREEAELQMKGGALPGMFRFLAKAARVNWVAGFQQTLEGESNPESVWATTAIRDETYSV